MTTNRTTPLLAPALLFAAVLSIANFAVAQTQTYYYESGSSYQESWRSGPGGTHYERSDSSYERNRSTTYGPFGTRTNISGYEQSSSSHDGIDRYGRAYGGGSQRGSSYDESFGNGYVRTRPMVTVPRTRTVMINGVPRQQTFYVTVPAPAVNRMARRSPSFIVD